MNLDQLVNFLCEWVFFPWFCLEATLNHHISKQQQRTQETQKSWIPVNPLCLSIIDAIWKGCLAPTSPFSWFSKYRIIQFQCLAVSPDFINNKVGIGWNCVQEWWGALPAVCLQMTSIIFYKRSVRTFISVICETERNDCKSIFQEGTIRWIRCYRWNYSFATCL